MKTTLKLDLPTTDAIAADLEPLSCYPQLTAAEEQLATATAALADARQALEDATTTADEMPARVHAGQATQADLEQAISAVKATEVMLPFHVTDLEAAQEALAQSKREARAAVIEEARRRRDRLQATINEDITPVLDALRELDRALQEAVRTNAPEPGGAIEISQALKLAPPIDAIGWPVSVALERRLNAGNLTGVSDDGRVLS